MPGQDAWVVVGLDNGGNKNNATVLDPSGRFLVDRLVETPEPRHGRARRSRSRRSSRPSTASSSAPASRRDAGARRGPRHARARPAPTASSRRKGSTNFAHAGWRGFDFRGALEARLRLPVVYNNDGNAAALYAHHVCFGAEAARHSSVSAIVGTGPGRRRDRGRADRQGRGRAWPASSATSTSRCRACWPRASRCPHCNCGFDGDAESVASLTGIEKNLLPYWLTRFPDHELARRRSLAQGGQARARPRREGRPAWRRKIFEQQAMAIGRLFTIAANFTDPDAYFVGGGVVETAPRVPRVVPGQGAREHAPARGAGAGGPVRPRPRPRHGRRARRRPGRPRIPERALTTGR